MTIRDALDIGLLKLEPIGGDKGDRAVSLDGSYTFWYRPGTEKPYRWARAEVSSQPEQAACTEGIARHGGCRSLIEAIRTTVLLRTGRSRGPTG